VSALAVLLIAVGIGDIARGRLRAGWPAPTLGITVVIAVALLAGLWQPGDIAPIVVAAVTCGGWLALGAVADETGRHRIAPLLILGTGVTALILLSGMASDVGGPAARWASSTSLAGGVTADRILVVIGIMLIQVATANQVVRLVLGSVGAVRPAGQPQPSDQLKGGRLLGPMERLLIVGLGVAGQLTMASAVVAAKSIIRFPEISAKRDGNGNPEHVGIDDVTEYFLVGSFTSWMVAFGTLAILGL
jgi:hypothetical protein